MLRRKRQESVFLPNYDSEINKIFGKKEDRNHQNVKQLTGYDKLFNYDFHYKRTKLALQNLHVPIPKGFVDTIDEAIAFKGLNGMSVSLKIDRNFMCFNVKCPDVKTQQDQYGFKMHVRCPNDKEGLTKFWEVIKNIAIDEKIPSSKVTMDYTSNPGSQITIYCSKASDLDWENIVNKINNGLTELNITATPKTSSDLLVPNSESFVSCRDDSCTRVEVESLLNITDPTPQQKLVIVRMAVFSDQEYGKKQREQAEKENNPVYVYNTSLNNASVFKYAEKQFEEAKKVLLQKSQNSYYLDEVSAQLLGGVDKSYNPFDHVCEISGLQKLIQQASPVKHDELEENVHTEPPSETSHERKSQGLSFEND